VAFAESDILKSIWLEMIMKTIQFKNIKRGILLTKSTKNQKLWVIVDSIEPKAQIQSAFNAIYGPMIKLKTVIGISNTKYNFSVEAWVLKETWIFPQE